MCKETGGIVVNEIVWHNKHKPTNTHTHSKGRNGKEIAAKREGRQKGADCKTRSKPETKCPTVARTERDITLRTLSKSRYHWRGAKLWNNVDSWEKRGFHHFFYFRPSRLKFHFECKMSVKTSVLCDHGQSHYVKLGQLTGLLRWLEMNWHFVTDGRVWLRRKLLVNPSCGLPSK